MKMKKDQANSIPYVLIFKLMISKDSKLKSPNLKNEKYIINFYLFFSKFNIYIILINIYIFNLLFIFC